MYNENSSIFCQPMEAILPAYDNEGNNICHIISSKGTCTTVPMSRRKFMRLWFQFLRMDLYAQSMWSHNILGQRNLNPVIANEYIILIPVKTRESIGSKDGCYGYIRLSSIKSIRPGEILLQSGVTIAHLSSVNTIKTKIRHGNLLKYIYLEELQTQHNIYTNSHLYFDKDKNIDEDNDEGNSNK